MFNTVNLEFYEWPDIEFKTIPLYTRMFPGESQAIIPREKEHVLLPNSNSSQAYSVVRVTTEYQKDRSIVVRIVVMDRD